MERTGAAKVYLAGPSGFTPAGLAYHVNEIVPRVRKAGFEPLDPWDLPSDLAAVFALPKVSEERRDRLADTNRAVGRRNAELIRACDGVLAVLDGCDVDSGTAAEIGYAAALAKPVVGVRTDLRITGDNEATLVNLQVEWFVVENGGSLWTDLDDAIEVLRSLLG